MRDNFYVYVNGRYKYQRLTGVQRYAIEVISRFLGKFELIVPGNHLLMYRGPFWEQIILPRGIMKNGILWSPTNTGPLAIKNQVVTIHDLSPIDHPEWFSSRFAAWYQFLLPRLTRRVEKIITDSNFTLSRLVEVLNIPEEKVQVIPLGVSDNFQPINQPALEQIQAKYNLTKPYILSLGSLEPRKNIIGITQAWNRINHDFPEFELVIVGDTGFPFKDPGIDRSISRLRLLGRIADQDLPGLYSGALCFVYPSVYEGFGLPVLEAMACGAPVITSNTTSLPEVAGDACLLINPHSSEDISEAILKVLQDGNLRETLRIKGIHRAREFSWDTTAAQVWDTLITTHEEIFS